MVPVTKIAWGFAHMLVLLENGNVLVSGSNGQGQLNLDPDKTAEVEGLLLHEFIWKKYDVIDIGCGSAHSVFFANLRKFFKIKWILLIN